MSGVVEKMRASRKVLAEYNYEPAQIERGYAGKTLYINLSNKNIISKDVTQQMKDIFIGGKGFGLWYLWNAVKPDTKWNDPEKIRRTKLLFHRDRFPESPSIRGPENHWLLPCHL